jgi:hypothetical protein
MAVVGSVKLMFFDRGRLIRGGPFDDYAPPAIGLCLDAGSARAGEAALRLDLADYTAPSPQQMVATLAALLRAMRAAPELPVYIGCRAGLGRTGTLIAALAKLAGHDDPVGWTRRYYDSRAVENPGQEAAVAALDPAAVWAALQEPE